MNEWPKLLWRDDGGRWHDFNEASTPPEFRDRAVAVVPLAAAQGLAEVVREEYPTSSMIEVIETWTPATVTPEMRAAIAAIERGGGFGS